MKPYEPEELEVRGRLDTLLSGKPVENGWKEINNLLVVTEHVGDLAPDALKKAAGKWGAKFNDTTNDKRSTIYRKLAVRAYTEMQTGEDPLLGECSILAQYLELSPQLVHLADRAAKKMAYGERCRQLVAGKTELTVENLNLLFSYDYDDGLIQRREVFEEYFYRVFEKFEETQRYSVTDEEDLVRIAKMLDVPFELKENLTSALSKFRNLWNAETQELQPIAVQFDLFPEEKCYAGTNSGRCEMKMVQVEENFFDRNRKFNADDTLAFKQNSLDSKKEMQQQLMIEEIGYFFLTNQRLIFISKNSAVQHMMADVTGADYKDNCIFFHMKDGKDAIYKYSDEASECMFMMFKRVRNGQISAPETITGKA